MSAVAGVVCGKWQAASGEEATEPTCAWFAQMPLALESRIQVQAQAQIWPVLIQGPPHTHTAKITREISQAGKRTFC